MYTHPIMVGLVCRGCQAKMERRLGTKDLNTLSCLKDKSARDDVIVLPKRFKKNFGLNNPWCVHDIRVFRMTTFAESTEMCLLIGGILFTRSSKFLFAIPHELEQDPNELIPVEFV